MKASKQRRARARKTSKARPVVAVASMQPAFSDQEEAFFREGAELSAASSSSHLERFSDLDAGHEKRPGLWRRLLAWTQPSDQRCTG